VQPSLASLAGAPAWSGRQELAQNANTPGKRAGETMNDLAQSFDLTNEFNILRLICGLFFIPHIYAKFFVPEALGFFVAAKFNRPKAWLYTACVIEIVVAIGLIFAIYPLYAGAIACIELLVAAGAVWKVTKGRWLWNVGGYEYCVFWAICCLVVVLHYR
jgi:putative oxidoreductase